MNGEDMVTHTTPLEENITFELLDLAYQLI